MPDEQPKKNKAVQYLKVGGLVYLGLVGFVVVLATLSAIYEQLTKKEPPVISNRPDLVNKCAALVKETLPQPGTYQEVSHKAYGSVKGGPEVGVVLNFRARNPSGEVGVGSSGCYTSTGQAKDMVIVPPKEEKPPARMDAREIELNVGIPCKRLARQMMRDPDSFEAIAINPYNSTADGKPVNGVVVQYRARNGFGGYGGGSVTCESPSGRMEDTVVVSHSEN